MTTPSPVDHDDLREQVRTRYADAARAVLSADATPSEAAASCCAPDGSIAFGDALYGAEDRAGLPAEAVLASLGCGNPSAVAALASGEIVLDLGSGGGIDVLLSAQRVGPTGFAYGLDMTDEMLELAERNRVAAGATNVSFLKGEIEAVPLPDASVDVVISNCVINLSSDKAAVLREIARVLRPGGRMGVSDVVADDDLSPADRASRGSLVGCVAGALSFAEYREGLDAAGLTGIELERSHVVADGMSSVIVRAEKPRDWTPDRVRATVLPTPLSVVAESDGCCGGTGCC